jgi:hypothetical protein
VWGGVTDRVGDQKGSEEMANGVLFIGWGPAVFGREQKALQVFNEGLQYWTRLQQQGAIEGFEVVNLEPHGGDLAGFLLIRGDEAILAQLRVNREFQSLNLRAGLVVMNFGVVAGSTGERLTEQFSEFGRAAAELA